MHKAIIFVGFPGVGKTYIGRKLAENIPNMVHIEQDSFYVSGRCDTDSYLDAIHESIQNHNIVLCKNHHTRQSLDEVLKVLKANDSRYIIFNFIPEIITDEFIENLLDRIEKRGDGANSHLKIDKYHSRKRSKQIILNKYEEPNEKFIRLDYLARLITKMYKRLFR